MWPLLGVEEALGRDSTALLANTHPQAKPEDGCWECRGSFSEGSEYVTSPDRVGVGWGEDVGKMTQPLNFPAFAELSLGEGETTVTLQA